MDHLKWKPRQATRIGGGVAIDGINGTLHAAISTHLKSSGFDVRPLQKPITREQLVGTSLLLLCAPVRNETSYDPIRDKDQYLYQKDEAIIIRDFVLSGGTLVCAGIGWAWVYEDYGNKKIEFHPMNQLGAHLDFELMKDTGKPAEKIDSFILKNSDFPKEEKATYSEVRIEKPKATDLLQAADGTLLGGSAKRGEGQIYVFGSQWILAENPSIVSAIAASLDGSKSIPSGKIIESGEVINKRTVDKKGQSSPNTHGSQPLVTLSEGVPGIVQWISAPIREQTPDEIYENVVLLRELILDEGYSLPANKRSAHAAGSTLCRLIIEALDERYEAQIAADLMVARRKSDAKLSNQALDARRNYLMSWPQYAREVEQRSTLLEYRKDAKLKAEKEGEQRWGKRGIELKGQILRTYQVMRHRMREQLDTPN